MRVKNGDREGFFIKALNIAAEEDIGSYVNPVTIPTVERFSRKNGGR